MNFAVPFLCLNLLIAAEAKIQPRVEVEEVIATCEPPGNGAGPFWCYGAPLLVRQGDRVFASVMETGKDVPPLCNTRWRFFAREQDGKGWRLLQQADEFRQREPCPLVIAADRLVLSVNPSVEPVGTKYGRCRPQVLRFNPSRTDEAPAPVFLWDQTPAHFTDHSYRGIAADSGRGELLVLNIDAQTSAQHWALVTADGQVARSGAITFPIRACYPQAALRDRAAHVLAIGDIVEPNEEWRAFKKQKTGREWDYVFRRLFYTATPDLTRSGFSDPVEIDTVDATGGHITNLDLWLDPQGVAHVLYLKTTTTGLIRDRDFPGQPIVTTLEHVELAHGRVARRSTLVRGGENAQETPQYARFHATDDGTLWVVASVWGRRPDGAAMHENRIFPALHGQSSAGDPVTLGLKTPFSMFFTAAERGGSRPSNTLDLLGIAGDDRTLRYARIRLR